MFVHSYFHSTQPTKTFQTGSDQFLGCLGRTLSGHHHDDRMLQQAFPPELDWFIAINVRVDCGSRGRPSDSKGERMDIPTKKPRKSKKTPNPPWSDAR